MSEDIAWAAGLFEGEGCFYEARPSQFPVLGATLEMADEEIVRRFADVLKRNGVGGRWQVTTRWRGNENHSRQYAVKIVGQHAERVHDLLEPWLGNRRKDRARDILWRRRDAIMDASTVRACIGCGTEFVTYRDDKVWCTSACYHRVQSKTPHGRALANARNRRYKQRKREAAGSAINGTRPGDRT